MVHKAHISQTGKAADMEFNNYVGLQAFGGLLSKVLSPAFLTSDS